MKTKASDLKKSVKGNAVPVRFDDSDKKIIKTLAARTDLSEADVVRRSLRYAGPIFLSGKVNIGDVIGSLAAKA